MKPPVLFLLRIALALWSPLQFHTHNLCFYSRSLWRILVNSSGSFLNQAQCTLNYREKGGMLEAVTWRKTWWHKYIIHGRWRPNTFVGERYVGSGKKYIFLLPEKCNVPPKYMGSTTWGCQEELLRTWKWAKETTGHYWILWIWMTFYCLVYFKLFGC